MTNTDFNQIISGVKGHMDFLKEFGVSELDLMELGLTIHPDEVGEGRVSIEESQKKKPKKLPTSKTEALLALREEILPCIKCKELSSERTNVVFGTGNANAKLVFVGEAPGRDEDEQGKPFVGRAGKLLTKIIESIGLKREQVFIANVLKCRPPKNRNPKPEEITNCEPYLIKQLEIIQPKVICALGTYSAQTLLKTDVPISKMRGRFHEYHGIKLLPTFHPAYLLRNPAMKKVVWEDMKIILKELAKK